MNVAEALLLAAASFWLWYLDRRVDVLESQITFDKRMKEE